MIRIIDNKKVNLTDQEFNLYNEICQAYTTPRFKGEVLFKDLFESDEDGIIIFIKPPSKEVASLEVYLYVVSIMVHQHLRISTSQHGREIQELRRAKAEYELMIAEMKQFKENFSNG